MTSIERRSTVMVLGIDVLRFRRLTQHDRCGSRLRPIPCQYSVAARGPEVAHVTKGLGSETRRRQRPLRRRATVSPVLATARARGPRVSSILREGDRDAGHRVTVVVEDRRGDARHAFRHLAVLDGGAHTRGVFDREPWQQQRSDPSCELHSQPARPLRTAARSPFNLAHPPVLRPVDWALCRTGRIDPLQNARLAAGPDACASESSA